MTEWKIVYKENPSEQDMKILSLKMQGLTNWQIADELNLCYSSVSYTLKRLRNWGYLTWHG